MLVSSFAYLEWLLGVKNRKPAVSACAFSRSNDKSMESGKFRYTESFFTYRGFMKNARRFVVAPYLKPKCRQHSASISIEDKQGTLEDVQQDNISSLRANAVCFQQANPQVTCIHELGRRRLPEVPGGQVSNSLCLASI